MRRWDFNGGSAGPIDITVVDHWKFKRQTVAVVQTEVASGLSVGIDAFGYDASKTSKRDGKGTETLHGR